MNKDSYTNFFSLKKKTNKKLIIYSSYNSLFTHKSIIFYTSKMNKLIYEGVNLWNIY